MKKTIKCLVLGFMAMGFVACDSISAVFDKFSYDEVFDKVSYYKRIGCIDIDSKFTPPSELADEEKGLIGACEYISRAKFNTKALYEGYGEYYKNDELKHECKTGQSEDYTELMKVDEKSGALLKENKYKVITIVELAEYSEKNGQGFCKIRKVYKLKRGQPYK